MGRWYGAGLALLVVACGGGGGSGSGSAPAAQAPVFSSGAEVSTVENRAQVYTATASGNRVSFAIAGGADADLFALTPDGVLSFRAAPDYESPRDSGRDNVYDVVLSASGGGLSTTQAVAVRVTNDREGVTVRRVTSGYHSPVAISTIPGDPRLLVGLRDGTLWLLDPANGSSSKYGTTELRATAETTTQGMIAMTTGPAWAGPENGVGAVFAAVLTVNGVEIRGYSRMELAASLRTGMAYQYADIYRAFPTANPDTIDGWMGITPKGVIYSAFSDGSRPTFVHVIEKNPDPYAGASVRFWLIETLATGFRMPVSGAVFGERAFLADRGATAFGEINLIDEAVPGRNYGWPYKEGTTPLSPLTPGGLTDPLLQVGFGSGPLEGNAIVAGPVYAGANPSLADKMIFADRRGIIWTAANSLLVSGSTLVAPSYQNRTEDFAPDIGKLDDVRAIIAGLDGKMYILDGDGEVFQVDFGG